MFLTGSPSQERRRSSHFLAFGPKKPKKPRKIKKGQGEKEIEKLSENY